MQEEAASEGHEYRFAALKLPVVGGATGNVGITPVKISLTPAESLQQVAPTVAPTATAATAWVNLLFADDDRVASPSCKSQTDHTHSSQPMQWKSSTNEVCTTIRGQTQFVELRNSTIRCIDECNDEAILSFKCPLHPNHSCSMRWLVRCRINFFH